MADGSGVLLKLAGALAVLGAGGAAIGLSLPQIATKDEIASHVFAEDARYERLAGEVLTLQQQLALQQIESAELRVIRLTAEIERRKALGEHPVTLMDERAILLRRIEILTQQLQGP